MPLSYIEETELRAVVAALQRPPPELVDADFPEQADYVRSPEKRMCLCCSRRSGKSYGMGLRLFRAALATPGSTAAYFGLTRMSSKAIMWSPILKQIARRFKIRCTPNETELRLVFPNGSAIQLVGLDCDESQMEKALGQKPSEVMVDECQAMRIDLERFCRETIGPALIDHQAPLTLSGVPNGYTSGYFHSVSQGQKPRFKLFHWLADKNRHVKSQWEAEIATLKSDNPEVESEPWFINSYLGRWVLDTSNLVYSGYQDVLCDYEKLPAYDVGEWHYGLGIDPGLTDAAAFVVIACHDQSPTCYVPEAFSKAGMDITAMAGKAREIRSRYPPMERVVADSAAAQTIAEMRNRHDLPDLQPCESKLDKWGQIQVLNAEYRAGRLLLHTTGAAPLRDEIKKLRRRKRGSELLFEEDSKCANHCTDSGLYIWKAMKSYLTMSNDQRDELTMRMKVPVSHGLAAAIEREHAKDRPTEEQGVGTWE